MIFKSSFWNEKTFLVPAVTVLVMNNPNEESHFSKNSIMAFKILFVITIVSDIL